MFRQDEHHPLVDPLGHYPQLGCSKLRELYKLVTGVAIDNKKNRISFAEEWIFSREDWFSSGNRY